MSQPAYRPALLTICARCGAFTADRNTHDRWHREAPAAQPAPTPTKPITIPPRAADVLRELLRDGADNKTIAKRLFIATDTVKTHLTRIYDATGCRSRVALLNALRTGRIVLDPDITQEEK